MVKNEIKSMAFSPDGKEILCGCSTALNDVIGGVVLITKVPSDPIDSGDPQAVADAAPIIVAHRDVAQNNEWHGSVDYVCWSSDGNYISFAVSDNKHVEIWRRVKDSDGTISFKRPPYHTGNIAHVVDQKITALYYKESTTSFDLTLVCILAHGDNTSTMHVWHVCSGQEIVAPIHFKDTVVHMAKAVQCDNSSIVYTIGKNCIKMWDISKRASAITQLSRLIDPQDPQEPVDAELPPRDNEIELFGKFRPFAFDEFKHGEDNDIISSLGQYVSRKDKTELLEHLLIDKSGDTDEEKGMTLALCVFYCLQTSVSHLFVIIVITLIVIIVMSHCFSQLITFGV
jgi:hypothetical protein